MIHRWWALGGVAAAGMLSAGATVWSFRR
jgi:hypothetical protein